jgi:hypothetical protein
MTKWYRVTRRAEMLRQLFAAWRRGELVGIRISVSGRLEKHELTGPNGAPLKIDE